MKITLNSKKIITKSKTLLDLLQEHDLGQEMVAIEVDGKVVPRSQLGLFIITENIKIEIITFVGGG